VSSSDISVILEQDPVLCDVVGVDGVVIVTALPLAPSLYTSDIIAIACALTGMVCDLDDLALYQRLVDPERPAVSGVYTVGSVLLPADLYLPSDARPGLTLLQRELDVEPSECVAPVRANVCLVFFFSQFAIGRGAHSWFSRDVCKHLLFACDVPHSTRPDALLVLKRRFHRVPTTSGAVTAVIPRGSAGVGLEIVVEYGPSGGACFQVVGVLGRHWFAR
jgi:hypothetical protein